MASDLIGLLDPNLSRFRPNKARIERHSSKGALNDPREFLNENLTNAGPKSPAKVKAKNVTAIGRSRNKNQLWSKIR